MTTKPPVKPSRAASRHALLGRVHQGTARLFGREDRAAHASFVETHTGKRSCRDCTAAELRDLIRALAYRGAIAARAHRVTPAAAIRQPGGLGPDRPTPRQWAFIVDLARARGWDEGLEDPRLNAFIRRTVFVDAPRFLTRAEASRVITGLRRWQGQTA